MGSSHRSTSWCRIWRPPFHLLGTAPRRRSRTRYVKGRWGQPNRMKLWATNEVRAKSKFWYFLRKLKKVKKANGQMLAINETFEKNPTTIKNFGIWLRYQSRTGYHNMYKEYRDTTLNDAVDQIYTEMASRHRVRSPCIQIIKIATVHFKLCKRDNTKQFHNAEIKFPLVYQKVRPPTRKLKTTYKATRPNLFM